MNKLNEAVCDAIDKALTCRVREPKFRVFVNGAMNYQACVKVAEEWRAGKGSPHLQLKDILGSNSILSINQIATWSNKVRSALIESIFAAGKNILFETSNIVDTYTFVSSGKGETPFGAHIDFEDSIIIDQDGAGREIRTWPIGSYYGEILSGSPTHFGTSFRWKEYSSKSTTNLLHPGQIEIVKARQPHIFHTLGAGYFLGLSTLPNNNEDDNLVRSSEVVYESYALSPINDDLYIDKIIPSIPVDSIIDSLAEVTVKNIGRIYYHGRSMAITENEIQMIQSFQEDNELQSLSKNLVIKLIRIGALKID